MKKAILIIVICCVGFFAYSNTFHNYFQFDGKREIVESPAIRNLSTFLNEYFSLGSRFVSHLTFVFNYHFHGLDVVGYHITNLAIHIGAALLVWWLALLTFSTPIMKNKQISRHAPLIAFFAGLIFVTHPVQTQAVTYIMQRATSLVNFFYLAALCCYVKWRLGWINKGSLAVRILCVLGFFTAAALGVFTKELIITLPLIILLYEICFLRIKDFLNWKYISVLLILLAIIYSTMIGPRLHMLGLLEEAMKARLTTPPVHYMMTQFRVLVTYIRLFFIPVNQTVDYDYAVVTSIREPALMASIFLLGLILFAAFKLYPRRRMVSFGILYFFIAFLPEFTLMPLFFFLNKIPREVIFEERMYIPMTGLSLFLASGAYYVFGRKSIKRMTLILAGIVTVLAVLTYNRNFAWESEFTLWKDAVRKAPRKARPYNNRGRGYFDIGKPETALTDFTKAIELKPDYTDAYYNRAFVHHRLGNTDEAIADYKRAIKTNPGYFKAYFNMGNVYKQEGDIEKAISQYNKVILLAPQHFGAYGNRGNIYAERGDFGRAIADYNKAIEIDPRNGKIHYARSISYFKKGDYKRAWKDVNRAEELGQKVDSNFREIVKKASGGS